VKYPSPQEQLGSTSPHGDGLHETEFMVDNKPKRDSQDIPKLTLLNAEQQAMLKTKIEQFRESASKIFCEKIAQNHIKIEKDLVSQIEEFSKASRLEVEAKHKKSQEAHLKDLARQVQEFRRPLLQKIDTRIAQYNWRFLVIVDRLTEERNRLRERMIAAHRQRQLEYENEISSLQQQLGEISEADEDERQEGLEAIEEARIGQHEDLMAFQQELDVKEKEFQAKIAVLEKTKKEYQDRQMTDLNRRTEVFRAEKMESFERLIEKDALALEAEHKARVENYKEQHNVFAFQLEEELRTELESEMQREQVELSKAIEREILLGAMRRASRISIDA
jgi:hypothetical protein